MSTLFSHWNHIKIQSKTQVMNFSSKVVKTEFMNTEMGRIWEFLFHKSLGVETLYFYRDFIRILVNYGKKNENFLKSESMISFIKLLSTQTVTISRQFMFTEFIKIVNVINKSWKNSHKHITFQGF